MPQEINLSKSIDFFDPSVYTERIHIIGCGAVGSTVAEILARTGWKNFALYDFDTVEAHNIANQMFTSEDIGKKKVDAVKEIMCKINPALGDTVSTFDMGYINQRLSGYVFLCVDNIDLTRSITESLQQNLFVKGVFNIRMRLTDAQHYAADWHETNHQEALLNSMQFSHEEAVAQTPVSACNLTLSFAPTVRVICSYAVANFVNFVKGKDLKKVIIIDAFDFQVDAF